MAIAVPKMKILISAFAITLGWATAVSAATPAPLTTLAEVHALTNAEAAKALPVAFQATVTYFRGYERTLFVQDGDAAIYVSATTDIKLTPGDRILVRGTTHDSFRPYVQSKDITLLYHGTIPKPQQASYEELARAQRDCMLVTVRGVVRSADVVLSSDRPQTSLQMAAEGGSINAVVDNGSTDALSGLLDAEVEITGAASGRFDGKMQQTGVLIHVPSMSNVKVLKRANEGPWSLPVTAMDEILASAHVEDTTQRVRVQGTITYYQPGSAVVLQAGAKSLWIETQQISPMRVGDLADATGFPIVRDGFLTLSRGEIRDSLSPAPIVPDPATWLQLSLSHNLFDLVSIEGKLVTEVREGTQDEYVLESDGKLFTAIYRHPPPVAGIATPPLREVPLGSRLRITGICILENSNPFDAQVPFNILMRTQDDIAVVASPSLLNVRNLIILVALLLLAVFAVGARGWYIEHRVRRQTTALAYIEQRRGRILEQINGARPLPEIVEQITEVVSFRLSGAPCWCETADGLQVGNRPPKITSQRVARQEIPSRSGAPHGAIFAAFDSLAKQTAEESSALSMGAGLAALAIETSRLYSDLIHRSEFDLLTDLHNRFFLEKQLEATIVEAREAARTFGLIYIDLDDFKSVNDVHGHQAGDRYLQEAAQRMKAQVRPGDLLARLGGDEFAVLVSVVRSRADVEEIALRLERCFDSPFAGEDYVLNGSASVGIALFPEDGTTGDSLLSAADAAMYVEKYAGKNVSQPIDATVDPRPAREAHK
jgi:diguanylate cyclase (GGDEF)-like protein